MTQHIDPGSGLPNTLSRAVNPRVSMHSSSPLHPPSARAQVWWLQTKFNILALKGGACVFRHLLLPDRISGSFHSQVLCGHISWFCHSGLGCPALEFRLIRENLSQLRYPSGTSVAASGAKPALLCLHTSYQSQCELLSLSFFSLIHFYC